MKHAPAKTTDGRTVCKLCKVRYPCLEAQREIINKGVPNGQAAQSD